MALERTLSIIKPDAVGKNAIGQIVARFEAAGLKMLRKKCCTCQTKKPAVSMLSTPSVLSTVTWLRS